MNSATTVRGGEVAAPRRPVTGELVFALAVAALGGFVLVTTGDIYQPPGTTVVGPRVFPYVVGAMLLVLGVALVVAVLRGHTGSPEESEDLDADAPTSWATIVALVVVLMVHVNLIVPAGWPVAAAVLFAATSFILGSRRVLLTLGISVALAVALQVLFAHVLGLGLPPGPLLEGVTWFRG
jgi:putative tricarboxylic transport membrane protein